MGLLKHAPASTTLHVIARAPFQVYYEGDARAVSASNKVGDFDVLPGHADFFSMLIPGEITIETGSANPITFTAHNGIITVRDDEVMLFVNM
ncbi:MAG TPA: F0F1 ATP synthase subunit epsilon [Candidatus Saccharimonadales bacterium]